MPSADPESADRGADPSAVSESEVARLVLVQGVSATRASAGMVYGVHADALVLLRADGYPDGSTEAFARIPLDAPVPGAEAVRTRRPILVESPEAFAAEWPHLAYRPTRSAAFACLPLVTSEVAHGLLVLSFEEPRAFGDDDRTLMIALANLGAIALERARLSERERLASRRATLLARASHVLAASRDDEVALDALAALLVPEVADGCLIELVEEGAQPRVVAVAHRDPTNAELVRTMRERWPPDPAGARGVAYVLRTGHSELTTDVTEELLREVAQDEEHLAALLALRIRSLLVVPVRAHGRVLGAISLASERTSDAGDVERAEEIGHRLGLAIENLRLVSRAEAQAQRERAVAELGSGAISASTDSTLRGAVELVARELGVELTAIFELRERGEELVLRAGIGFPDEALGSTSASGPDVTRALDPEAGAARPSLPPLVRERGAQTGVTVLIPGLDRPFGVLGAYALEPRQFSRSDVQLLSGVANILAASIARERWEAQLEGSRARLFGILDSAMDAILTIDAEHRVLLFNAAAERMFGYSAQEMIGQPVHRLLPEPLRAGHRAHVARFGATGISRRTMGTLGTIVGQRRDGTVFPLEATISKLVDRGQLLMSVILRDVTERAQADLELRRERDFVAAIVDTVGALVVVLDRQGRIVRWNPECERVSGYSFDEVRGKAPWEVLLPPEEVGAVREQFDGLRASALPGTFDNVWLTRSGERRHIAWSNTVLTSESGEVEFVLGTGIDITERMAHQRELEDAARHKDDFLAMLGHELRNPLAAIHSALQLTRMTGGKNPAVVEKANAVMERQAAHMARLIDDLLDVSRIVRGKVELRFEPVELHDVLRTVIADHEALAERRRVTLTLDAGEPLAFVRGDRARMVQVAGNLIANALKFTEPGGAVTVTLRAGEPEHELEVRDTGVGIDPDVLEHMFEPFRQADTSLARTTGGLGLGLSVVRGLVELHGGSVSAASEGPGRGSRFTVRLPASSIATPTVAAARTTGRPAVDRVLIVEDNPDTAEVMRGALELAGFRVEVAHDAEEALARVRAHDPEVVLCDIGLPGAMSGYDLARTLTSQERRPLLVAVTGYGRPSDREAAYAAGFDAHLTKPVDLEAIEEVLRELTRAR